MNGVDLISSAGGSGPPSKDVLENFIRFSNCGNLNANFKFSKKAHQMVKDLKNYIYKLTNTNEKDYKIIFTSSASESNSSLFRSICDHVFPKKPFFLINCSEHETSIKAVELLREIGKIDFSYIPIEINGKIDITNFINQLNNNSNIDLVSIMSVNNELSSFNDIEKISKLCREKNVKFHCDCSQSFGKIGFDLTKIIASAITISPHKFGGIPGIGILMIKNMDIHFISQINGFSYINEETRGGTPPVGLIAACYAALKENFQDRKKKNEYISNLKNYFLNELRKNYKILDIKDIKNNLTIEHPSIVILGAESWHIALLSFIREPMCNKKMRDFLEKNGIYISLSSVCQTTYIKASRCVDALLKNVNENIHKNIKRGVVRFSFDERLKKNDIDYTVKIIKQFMNKKNI